eukprot:XP_001709636.1 Hypothetical protein GL50803_35268 [Giardia lamblia ATCC 50803]
MFNIIHMCLDNIYYFLRLGAFSYVYNILFFKCFNVTFVRKQYLHTVNCLGLYGIHKSTVSGIIHQLLLVR